MDALSPNTSAFLSYLSSVTDKPDIQPSNPTSLPPSAFFNMPIPGRDTPEKTTESSSVSPIYRAQPLASGSDGESPAGRRKSLIHKRKAGHNHTVQELESEDDSEDLPSGHEDKRAHPNDKASASRRGRKSAGNEDGKGTKEVGKAARRKEQNRAAQKAFRERRETKVRDLEDKVAELETKSLGVTTENENLRGILKRLQEENVALKQSAFTFSMPATSSGVVTPKTAFQSAKPLTPPHSVDGRAPTLPHRASSGMASTPESLVSIASGSGSDGKAPPSIDSTEMFNAFAMGVRPEWERQNIERNATLGDASHASRSNSGLSPVSSASNNKSEIDALWASFYPDGISSAIESQPQAAKTPAIPAPRAVNVPDTSSPYNLFMTGNMTMPTGSGLTPFINANANPIDKMAFRDSPAGGALGGLSQSATAAAAQDPLDWANYNDDSVDDFLKSLTGGGSGDSIGADLNADDEFSAQLQALLDQNNSPSAPFGLPGNNNNGNPMFSPTNYLNMSPSPLASVSNSQSPASLLDSNSNSASPQSTASSQPSSSGNDGTFGRLKAVAEVVHVVGEDGKIVKPSDLWVRMGMQHGNNVDHLVIDDLCDQMRAKATCKDGQHYLGVHDAERVFKYRGIDMPEHATRATGL